MPTPTVIGTTKGIFSHTETQTGLVFESVDYDYNTESVEFPDINSEPTAVAYFNGTVDISLKGFIVSGTAWSGTLASALTLSSTMPAYLKTGNTGGTTIIESIKIATASKAWRSIEIGAKYRPLVV
jgi:hypothetical protein